MSPQNHDDFAHLVSWYFEMNSDHWCNILVPAKDLQLQLCEASLKICLSVLHMYGVWLEFSLWLTLKFSEAPAAYGLLGISEWNWSVLCKAKMQLSYITSCACSGTNIVPWCQSIVQGNRLSGKLRSHVSAWDVQIMLIISNIELNGHTSPSLFLLWYILFG